MQVCDPINKVTQLVFIITYTGHDKRSDLNVAKPHGAPDELLYCFEVAAENIMGIELFTESELA